MQKTLVSLIKQLDDPSIGNANVIPWSCPVPAFGDLYRSKIATIGLNPSNREFLDIEGKELDGENRRFHTLNSFGLSRWSEANEDHIEKISKSCQMYFNRNPYNTWFRCLDYLISGTNTSYYKSSNKACHLDLIPFATKCKWMELSPKQRNSLLEFSADTLGQLLLESSINYIILNGSSVIESLQILSKIELRKEEMLMWELPRKTGSKVKGYAYTGKIKSLSGINLGREIKILGFNHNIQSSFGVTSKIKLSIQNWITSIIQKDEYAY